MGARSEHGPSRRDRLARRRLLAWAAGTLTAVAAVVFAHRRTRAGETDRTDGGGAARLDVVDGSGDLLDLEGLRRIQSNGAGRDGWDDQLLTTDTLEVLTHSPLYEDEEASAAVDLPDGRPATLTLSWPTSHGYSALLADIPGPGRHCLAELAARALHERQPPRLTALPAGRTRADVESMRERTSTALEECAEAVDPVERAVRGTRALEAAATAQLALDEACRALVPGDAVIGVTFTEPPDPDQVIEATGVGAGRRRMAARIVVDDAHDADELDSWRSTIAALHTADALALVQVCARVRPDHRPARGRRLGGRQRAGRLLARG